MTYKDQVSCIPSSLKFAIVLNFALILQLELNVFLKTPLKTHWRECEMKNIVYRPVSWSLHALSAIFESSSFKTHCACEILMLRSRILQRICPNISYE